MKKAHVFLIIALSLLVISAAAAVVYWPLVFPHDTPAPEQEIVETATTTIPAPKMPQYPCPLDGEPTTEEKGRRRPIAVMIENHLDARPQSGLLKACIVYETVAEGGITRFMALFVHNDVGTIGPVRSAREYFVDLAKQYNALYSHCGGPATIYQVFKNLNVASLDEFANSDAYWRDKGRRAPHNLYASTEKLWKKATERGYEQEAFYQRPNFKDDDPLEVRPANASIDINFSRPEFRVRYEYNRLTNSYSRFMAGQPHIDGVYNQQITPKNIAVQYVPVAKVANDPKGRMQVNLIGTGEALVFQDGRVVQATWQRPVLSELTRFYNANGAEIKFNRGQTWIELIDPVKMQVTYR